MRPKHASSFWWMAVWWRFVTCISCCAVCQFRRASKISLFLHPRNIIDCVYNLFNTDIKNELRTLLRRVRIIPEILHLFTSRTRLLEIASIRCSEKWHVDPPCSFTPALPLLSYFIFFPHSSRRVYFIFFSIFY